MPITIKIGGKSSKKSKQKFNTQADKQNNVKSGNGESRAVKFGKTILNYGVVKPLKTMGNIAMAGIANELPQLALLMNAFGEFAGDIKQSLKKSPNKDTHIGSGSTMKSDGAMSSMSDGLKTIDNSIKKLTEQTSKNHSENMVYLKTLVDIHGELRTLSSITAKVWGANLKSTRSNNKRDAENALRKRFEEQLKSSQDEKFSDILKSIGHTTKTSGKEANDNKEGMGGFVKKLITSLKDHPILTSLGLGTAVARAGALMSGAVKAGKTAVGGIGGIAGGLATAGAMATGVLGAGVGFGRLGENIINADWSTIGGNIKGGYTNAGIMGAVQATITDEQVIKIGKSIVQGFDEVFTTLGIPKALDNIVTILANMFGLQKQVAELKNLPQNMANKVIGVDQTSLDNTLKRASGGMGIKQLDPSGKEITVYPKSSIQPSSTKTELQPTLQQVAPSLDNWKAGQSQDLKNQLNSIVAPPDTSNGNTMINAPSTTNNSSTTVVNTSRDIRETMLDRAQGLAISQ
jgi:hypothetical protein